MPLLHDTPPFVGSCLFLASLEASSHHTQKVGTQSQLLPPPLPPPLLPPLPQPLQLMSRLPGGCRHTRHWRGRCGRRRHCHSGRHAGPPARRGAEAGVGVPPGLLLQEGWWGLALAVREDAWQRAHEGGGRKAPLRCLLVLRGMEVAQGGRHQGRGAQEGGFLRGG